MKSFKIIAVLVLTGVLIGLETWIERTARRAPERQPGQVAVADEHDHHD